MPLDNSPVADGTPMGPAAGQKSLCRCLVDLLEQHAKPPPPEATAYIESVERYSPARRVRRSEFNAAVRIAMQKMGFVQEGESITIEYPLLTEAAHDPRIEKIYAQPPPLHLDYVTSNGKRIVTKTHVDAFVLFKDGRVILVEGKAWAVAQAGHLEQDPRFFRDPNSGRFVDVPVVQAATRLGLPHIVFTEQDVNYTLLSNLLFLGRGYLHKWAPGATTANLLKHIQRIGVSTIETLLESSDWTSDDVYGSIAQGLVYADLKSIKLAGLTSVNVYASEAVATLLAAPPRTDPVVASPNIANDLEKLPDLSKYSVKALAIAWERFAAIKPVVVGLMRPRDLPAPAREWWRKFKRAAAKWGAGILGLIPDFQLRGHHGSHLSDKAEELLQTCIQKTLDPDAHATEKGYGAYRKASKEIGPTSKKTFYQRLAKAKLDLDTIAKTKGEKAAYQATPAAPLSIAAVSRLAGRAWQLGIIDHTPLPIRCKLTISGKQIALSPWLTYMRDAGTRRALGFYLAWHRPRKESVIATLWDCLKRYGRLTDGVMLDGEKGHDSVAVEQMLAREGVDKICRRYLRPRDGNEIERAFSYLERALLQFIAGNYVHNQNPKEWPRNWNPADFADRTIGSLYMMIRQFLWGYYNPRVRLNKLGGLTPDEADAMSSRMYGERGFMLHRDLNQSRYLLLPSVSRGGLRTLSRQHGLRLFGQDYLPPHPIDPFLYDKEYPVLSDPSDVRYVLSHVGGRWLEFQNRHKNQYEGLEPDMLAGVSVEIVQTARWHEAQADERADLHAEALDEVLAIPSDPLRHFHESLTSSIQIAAPKPTSVWDDCDDSDVVALPISTGMAA